MFCNLQSPKKNLACSQAAEKEAALARQEEEKAEQRKQSRAEKKASKKAKKNRIGEKRKADDDDEGEWGQEEEEGKKNECQSFGNRRYTTCLPAVKGRWGGSITALRAAVFSGALFPWKSSSCHEVKAILECFLARSECLKKTITNFKRFFLFQINTMLIFNDSPCQMMQSSI